MNFPILVKSILHLFKESVEFSLHKLLGESNNKLVTGGAFSQARYKIRPDFFKDLTSQLTEGYNLSNKRLWKGYSLIGGDGYTVNLPPSKEIREYFGINGTTKAGTNTYLARALFLYDVLNDFVLNAQLAKTEEGEKTLLLKAFQETSFSEKCIFLLDRGFGHFCTIKEFITNQRDFCIRLSARSNFSKQFLAQPQEDLVTTWYPTPTEKKNCKAQGLDLTPITLRAVKVELPSGEIELLVTSLTDGQKYTTQDMKELYHYRWGVEEGIKNLKPKMKLEQFGCRKSQGVFQEFYAHIFCQNLVSLFGQQADQIIRQKTKHRKYVYQYNWQTAFYHVRENLIDWINGRRLKTLIDSLINAISQSVCAVKPDRAFVRDPRNMERKFRITQFYK